MPKAELLKGNAAHVWHVRPFLDVPLKHVPSIYITWAGLICLYYMLAACTPTWLLYDAAAQISQRAGNKGKC